MITSKRNFYRVKPKYGAIRCVIADSVKDAIDTYFASVEKFPLLFPASTNCGTIDPNIDEITDCGEIHIRLGHLHVGDVTQYLENEQKVTNRADLAKIGLSV